MNTYQNNYALAKAFVDEIKEQIADIEKEYIREHNIANPDGSVPAAIYCIDDQRVFDEANEGCSAIVISKGLDKANTEAFEMLRTAEDALIAYALSLIPTQQERETLQKSVKHNNTIRKKVLDLAFRLDTKTIPA